MHSLAPLLNATNIPLIGGTVVPSTVQQLAILLLFVIPGTVYQAVLDRFRGPIAAEQDSTNRFFRAIAASAIFDSLYAIFLGPHLISLAGDKSALSGLSTHSREAGMWGLLLLVIVPSVAAWLEARYARRNVNAIYDSTPTAWDYLVKNRGSYWIRVRLKDTGKYVGGWYGNRSFTSTYPQDPDIYIQSEYQMNSKGEFLERIENTAGVYIPGASIELIQVIEEP
jgi:hypothetical protein